MSDGKINLLKAAALDFAMINLIDFFKGENKEPEGKALSSLFGGFGTNDEALFQSACSYAFIKRKVSVDEIIRVCQEIIDNTQAAARIREIIGKDEQSITIEEPLLDKDGNLIFDKKGNLVISKTAMTLNVRGGESIYIMSKMDKDQIAVFLGSSGSFETMGKNLQDSIKKVAQVSKDISNNPKVQNGVNEVKSLRNRIDNWFASNS